MQYLSYSRIGDRACVVVRPVATDLQAFTYDSIALDFKQKFAQGLKLSSSRHSYRHKYPKDGLAINAWWALASIDM